jgi:hypothetical protein
MKRIRVSRILGYVAVLFVITLFAGCGGGGGGGGDTKGGGEEITAPVITLQPDHQVVPLGGQAVFTVAATGGGLSYQWERSNDNGTTWNPISGATATSYSITSNEKITAHFRCIVTNSGGSITSDVAELAVVTVVFADEAAASGGNGTSWARAYASLQDALENHNDCEVWVAAGTYAPTTGTDRSATFQMVSNIAIYGGFTGSETCRQARNWETNVTTLSGDIGIKGDASDNCYHVVTATEVTVATLDGFTITGGNANGFSNDYPDTWGGGMLNLGSSPSVTNCTFSENSATEAGGGMCNNYSSPSVTNCTFFRNSAIGVNTGVGGGMYNYYSNPSVTNCTFSGNFAFQGGGMNNGSSSPTVINCTFSENSATSWGGGMLNVTIDYYRDILSSPSVTNCTFSRNFSTGDGGGMSNLVYSMPIITNCTFFENSASSCGGAIDNYYNSNPTIRNTIIWGNSAETGSQIYNHHGDILYPSTAKISHSCIQGGHEGEGNIDSDPLLYLLIEGEPLSGGYLALQAAPASMRETAVWCLQGYLQILRAIPASAALPWTWGHTSTGSKAGRTVVERGCP